jgi:hypothetical protein
VARHLLPVARVAAKRGVRSASQRSEPVQLNQEIRIESALDTRFRIPAQLLRVRSSNPEGEERFFQFAGITGFGRCNPSIAQEVGGVQSEACRQVASASEEGPQDQVVLPFDLEEVSTNLLRERYVVARASERQRVLNSGLIRSLYYAVRKALPVAVRKHLQRIHLADWRNLRFPAWPVDCSVDLLFEEVLRLVLIAGGGEPIPFVWFWPNGHTACALVTHDVEESTGRDYCTKVMELDETAGLRSSFQVVPEERYIVPPELLVEIRRRGHEVNVHDLNHDGKLFENHPQFLERVQRISHHRKEFGARGFRSAILYRNPEWFEALDFEYDMSMPNVAHLDPQRGGCCTVFPYFIGNLLELPLTTTQDYSLFHILQQYSLDLWDQQIDLIMARHGLISFNIHPDYIKEKRALAVYAGLLSRIRSLRESSNVWCPLPGELNDWWRRRAQLEIVGGNRDWHITGPGAEQACLAYAAIDCDRLVYRSV